MWLETYVGARIDVQTLDAELSEDDLNREEPTPSDAQPTCKRRPKVDDRRSRRSLSSWLQGRSRHRPGGPQGCGKSTCWILAGNDWFADEISDLGTRTVPRICAANGSSSSPRSQR